MVSEIDPASARAIAEQFVLAGAILEVERFGDGLINDTFLVTVDSAGEQRAILQRINQHVFLHPGQVMDNLEQLLDYVEKRPSPRQPESTKRLAFPRLYRTKAAENHLIDQQGNCWRAMSYIEQTQTLETIQNSDQAYAVGLALGQFHRLLSDLEPASLHDTLPGFHIAPGYYQQYQQRLNERASTLPSSAQLDQCCSFIEQHRSLIDRLEDGKQNGRLPPRIIHGDPKLNNFLFAQTSDQVVSMIDLDTVKPGLIHYDIGDCVRSCSAERDGSADAEAFNIVTAQAILIAYCSEMATLLTEPEYDALYDAIVLLPLELGIRFVTDHLSGDGYFKVTRSGENLLRAARQFDIVASIERQQSAIQAMIQQIAHNQKNRTERSPL